MKEKPAEKHSENSRAALKFYANSLNRAVVSAIHGFMPMPDASPNVARATRTMAVGVVAGVLANMIEGAPDDMEKGGRTALRAMARRIIVTGIKKKPGEIE